MWQQLQSSDEQPSVNFSEHPPGLDGSADTDATEM
jgi:hypothetical protein